MIATFIAFFSAATFNDKAIDLLTSAANGNAILCSEKYVHDADFSKVIARNVDGASFAYAGADAVRTQPFRDWVCNTTSEREALRSDLIKKLTSSSGTYDVSTIYYFGTDNRITDPLTTKVWKEDINLYRQIEGHRSNFTYMGIVIDYQLGVISSGFSVFSRKPVHLKPGLTDELIQLTIQKDGKPEKVNKTTLWFPYDIFHFSIRKSDPHNHELYLATVVNVQRNGKWTVYLFDESGNVQVNPISLMVF